MKRNRFLACIIVLALGVWGCDEEDDNDAGTGGTDAGPAMDAGDDDMDAGEDDDDAGGDDAGSDAGPPASFQIRVVNNLPGLTGTTMAPGGFHICLYVADNTSGAIAGDPNFVTQTLGPIPFRGVSPYLALPSVAPFNYIAAMYEPANLGDPAECPADPNDAAAPEAALIATVEADEVPVDSVNTAIASGLLPDTFDATGGNLPSICNEAPPAMATFTAACTQEAQMVIVTDDQTEPAADMIRIRVSNQTVNSTPPSGWTVCYDPSIVPNTPPAEGCIDTNPADTPVVLAGDGTPPGVAYGTVTDYQEIAPIQPTVPAMGAGGGIYLRVADGMGCPAAGFTAGDSCYPILADWPTGMAPPSDNIVPNASSGDIITLFISGLIQPPTPSSPMVEPYDASFFLWQDNFDSSSP